MDTSNVGFYAYLPNGLKVHYEFPIVDLEAMALIAAKYDDLIELTNILLSKGLSLEMPGLEAGEQSYEITHIARRTQRNKKDNTTTPIIDLYRENLSFSDLKTWVDTDDEIKAFESATGLKLSTIQPFPGTSAIKRGESPDADGFVIKLTRPVKAIWKMNPDYVEGSKTESKRIFVRWANATPATPQPPVAAAQAATTGERVQAEPSRMSELENQQVTITKAVKSGTIAGVGIKAGDKYEATAPFEVDGMTHPVRIQVFPEDVKAIEDAGYPFSESDNLRIPVILTTKDRGITRIGSVVPYKPQNSANANVGANQGTSEYKPNWTVIYSKVKHLYDDGKHMGNSVQMLFREGAFKNCKNDAEAIARIVEHKTGKAVGDPA